MIVGQQKPLEEIRQMLAPYRRVLIVGCGTCMAICNAGSKREVSSLRNALQIAQEKEENEAHTFEEHALPRQCEPKFFDQLANKVAGVDAILSLACGIGVQALSERFPELPVLPGVNTVFMGMPREGGAWDEWCAGCSDCRLEETGGICPIARCTKGMLNGPCAGSKNGKCEANKDMDCAWILIYKNLARKNQLDKMRQYYPARNFRVIPRPRRIINKATITEGGSNA